jgi:hypothetical protein
VSDGFVPLSSIEPNPGTKPRFQRPQKGQPRSGPVKSWC